MPDMAKAQPDVGSDTAHDLPTRPKKRKYIVACALYLLIIVAIPAMQGLSPVTGYLGLFLLIVFLSSVIAYFVNDRRYWMNVGLGRQARPKEANGPWADTFKS